MIYDIVIIGGAAAGLTAGVYTGRKKMNSVILTKEVGGQSLLTDTIENFPGFDSISGRELINRMRGQVEKYSVEIKEGIEVESIEKKNDDFLIKIRNGEPIETKSIIVATGKNPRRLNVPGEREFENKGLSFCSICDAPLFSGKDVAIVGGGNSGLEAAMDLTKYANKIYILEYDSKIKGDESTQEKLKQTGKVKFITNAEVREIKGSDFVEKIAYRDRKSEEIKELSVGGVFINIGWTPSSAFLKGFVDLNEQGSIIINPKTNESSISGIFAAGDVSDVKYHQCVIAAGEGAKAVLSAYEYLLKS
ncbi:MAG TPA: hypothetical protein ENG99_00430 [bacterium]|nr:hypothetical protein [bacterium]